MAGVPDQALLERTKINMDGFNSAMEDPNPANTYPDGAGGEFKTRGAIEAVGAEQAAQAAAARDEAVQARDGALTARNFWPTTAAGIGQGVSGYASLVGGSGGANGTFPLAFTGGTQALAPRGRFVVAGGALIQIIIDYKGHYSAGAPTFDFSASAGLTGASAAVVMGPNTAVGDYFVTVDTDAYVIYQVTTGPVATERGRYLLKEVLDEFLEFVPAKNLFNPANKQAGKYVDNSGNIASSVDWACTEYIPVVPGEPYTVSWLGTKRVGLAFYATDGATSPVSYNSGATNPITAIAPVGGLFLVVNVKSNVIPEPADIQIEHGLVATSYEPHGDPRPMVKADALPPLVVNKSYEETEVSKNLFNASTVRVGKYIPNNGSGISSAAGWGCSDFIPVTPGEAYTISGVRSREGLLFFTSASDSAPVSGSYLDTVSLPLTVVAPAGAAFLAINLHTSTATAYSRIQVEHGTSATAYTPLYGEQSYVNPEYIREDADPALDGASLFLGGIGTNESFVLARRNGHKIKRTVRPFPAVSLTDPSNFDFRKDYIDDVLVHSTTDDAAPYRVMGWTIGANHGYSMNQMTATAHGKTTADIGAVYAKGGVEYVILGIRSANALYLAARTSNTSVTTGTFTHVSGGTNTGNIVATAAAAAAQFYPPCTNRVIRCYVDGDEVTETSGQFSYRREARFVETYDVLERSTIMDWYISTGGVGVVPAGAAAFSVAISYVFDQEANCTIYSDFVALKAIALQDLMFAMAVRMATDVDGTVEYYVPKALPHTHDGTPYDYANIDSADTGTWSNRYDFTPARCAAGGILCDRLVQLTDHYGFALGYAPVLDAEPATRRTQATVKALQISNSSGKVYLSAIDKGNITTAIGDCYSVVAYRNLVLRQAGRTCAYAVRTADADYFYADWHAAGTDKVPVPPDLVGRAYQVVEKSANVTVLSKGLTAQLLVSVSNAASYGYLILKVLR